MIYLPEVLKILEGALKSNAQMAVNYANLLADKLEREGGGQYAKLIRAKISRAPRQLFSTAGSLNPLPVDSESRFTLADETRPTIDQAEVILDAMTSGRIDEFISCIERSDELISAGVGIAPSLLLYGPPGCGKTVLAKHVAARLELPLLTSRCDTLVSSFLGATSKNIRALFDHTASRPCVLFLDEFDSLAKARDDKHELGELKRVVVSLLQNIDALSANTVLIAATNHPQLLDPAVWRRFAYRIEILLPDTCQRRKLLQSRLGKLSPLKSLDALVELSVGLPGAIIEQAAYDAVRVAVLSNRNDVPAADIARRLIRAQDGERPLSVEEEMRILREKAPNLFDYRTLNELFGVSLRRIGQLFKDSKEV
jgi:ATP-dependent Zn protease